MRCPARRRSGCASTCSAAASSRSSCSPSATLSCRAPPAAERCVRAHAPHKRSASHAPRSLRLAVGSACRPRARAAEIRRTRLPTERRRSAGGHRDRDRRPVSAARAESDARPRAHTDPRRTGHGRRPSTIVVSTRKHRERNTFRSTASASSSAFNSSSSPGPNRLVSFINVVGSGTRPSREILQNRRHVNESVTFRHSVS